MLIAKEAKVDNEFLRNLRTSQTYINRKNLTVLNELSIYLYGAKGKMLPRGLYKTSLQVNFSENRDFNYPEYHKVTVEDKFKYETKSVNKSYAALFDYVSLIGKLDTAFAPEIKEANRVKGVYAIKSGELGDRIEYRSLPSIVDLDKLIENLK